MPVFYLRTRNSHFWARDEGHDYASLEAVQKAAIDSAIGIASDEIRRGSQSAAIEVIVEQEDGTALWASVASASVSPIITNDNRLGTGDGIAPDSHT